MIVSAQVTLSMGHRLPAYKGICSSPHGHNIRVVADISIHGDVFLDFKEISDVLHEVTRDFDHAMVLYREDPFVLALDQFNFRVVLLSVEPTTEALAQYWFNMMRGVYNHPDKRVIGVTVHETDKYRAICERSSDEVWRVR